MAGSAGCGGSRPVRAGGLHLPPAAPVTVPVPARRRPRSWPVPESEVALAERALATFGTALEGGDGELPGRRTFRARSTASTGAVGRVGALRLDDAAVTARRGPIVEVVRRGARGGPDRVDRRRGGGTAAER